MAIFKIEENRFIELEQTTFRIENLYEVKDLQKYIANSIEIIDPDLLVIQTEFSDWLDSRRSIDILCLDRDANLVVIEIKRTKDGGHMELQAIRYAAMIANMTFDSAVKAYKKYLKKIGDNSQAEEKILTFLDSDDETELEFNKDIKIILISANFSKELTTSILWLNEKQGIDIRCIRIKPQKDNEQLYFDIQQIIPLPETAEYQVKLKEKAVEERTSRIENKRAKSIFKQLFETEKIKIGDKVILKPAIEQGHNKTISSAEIMNSGQTCLKWNNRDELYSFSRLRKIMVSELNLEDVKPNWGFSLKTDWLNEDGIEMEKLLSES